LVSGLGLANQFQGEVYQVANLGKALITIALGWIVHWLLKGPSRWQLPSAPEHLEHLVGTMAIVLVVLFWMVII
jgi:multicomponent Na+:H+ antiporter subunit D